MATKYAFLNVDVRLDEKQRFTANLDDDLVIDQADIINEMAQQSSKFAWWAGLHIAACGLRDDLKRELDLLEAKLASEIRPEQGEKQPTEKRIKQEVLQNKEYQKLNARYLEAKRQVDVLYVGREALTQRKDMLVSMATSLRRERDGDPGRHADNIAALEERERQLREERGRDRGGRRR